MHSHETSHPGPERLLQYADGELPGRHSAHVRAHLEECWRCRAEVEEIQETISEYVRYEQALCDSALDTPAPWAGFLTRLERLIADRQNRSIPRGLALLKEALSD